MAMRTRLISWDVDALVRRKHKLDPRPAYQRGLVWSPAKQQLLIDTLLREYDVPKIYLRKLPDGSQYEYEVADGQQRLNAIWEFVEGKFALGEVSDSLPVLGNLAGKNYTQLSSTATDKLGFYQISIVEIEDATDVEIRDLFLRLQEGVSLNPAEKRNAMPGTMRDFIAELVQKQAVFRLTDVKNARFTYDDWAAHVTCLELAGGPVDLKATDLKKMYQTGVKFDQNGNSAKRIRRILNYMEQVLKNKPPEMDIKWGFVDLYMAISALDVEYVLSGREDEVASFYQSFEQDRRTNLADPSALLHPGRTEWDRDMYDYIEAFVKDGAKKDNIRKRHDVYLRAIHRTIPDLVPKDPNRDFTRDQKVIIWRRDGGICQNCQSAVTTSTMHTDHIVPHSQGGLTTICNGQTLCAACNLSKGSQLPTP